MRVGVVARAPAALGPPPVAGRGATVAGTPAAPVPPLAAGMLGRIGEVGRGSAAAPAGTPAVASEAIRGDCTFIESRPHAATAHSSAARSARLVPGIDNLMARMSAAVAARCHSHHENVSAAARDLVTGCGARVHCTFMAWSLFALFRSTRPQRARSPQPPCCARAPLVQRVARLPRGLQLAAAAQAPRAQARRRRRRRCRWLVARAAPAAAQSARAS